jgi:4'-phosphopantetheinyl transferase
VNLLERPGRAPLLEMTLRALPAPPALPFFSLSHSGRWVACAVSPTTPVGLDIERRDSSRDLAALAAQAFDPARQAWLAAQPADQRIDAFYRLWCEAEARIKLAQDGAGVYHLAHAELAIALCSRHALVPAPVLRLARLDAIP